ETDAALRRFNAAALGHAEIGAFADHLAIEVSTDDANRVARAVAGGIVGFVRGTDVGTDATEEQKVDWRLEDGLHQFLRRHGFSDTKQLARLGAQPDFLRRTRKDAAPSGDQRLVIILPARSRQREQSLALGKTRFRIG